MKVREVMTKQPAFCHLDTTLSAAAELMWKRKCGFLPVVGEGGNVIGVITDRDVGIALGTQNRRPSEVLVKDVMSGSLFTCTADDSIACVLTSMRIEGVRRLPVVNRDGGLVGVLSIDDLSLAARKNATKADVSYEDVEDTYRAIQLHAARIQKAGNAAA